MPITDEQLDVVAQAWAEYAALSPRRIQPRDLLIKRDLSLYRGLGISSVGDLARHLVDDRVSASVEMTMGHLYERALGELGPQKVTRAEKRTPGYQGIDFVHRTLQQVTVINLKSGLSTANSDISGATIRHLLNARDHWEAIPSADDNPLPQQRREVIMVRAVARGERRRTLTDEGILWLVGEAMWAYFGAGEGFLTRLSDALGRHPLDYERYEEEKLQVTERVQQYLVAGGVADSAGRLDWGRLVSMFP